MKKKLIVLALVLVAVVLFFILRQMLHRENGNDLRLSGNVEVTEMNLGFKTPGRIERLLVDEGQRVGKDDKLAVLDSREIESQVAQGEAQLRESSTRLAELVAGSRPQEIEEARAQLAQAEAELQKAKIDYERAQRLYKEEAISADRVEAAKRAYDVAVSQHRRGTEALSLVREGPRKEEIRVAETRIEQAKAALGAAQVRLGDTVLYAPVSGVILKKHSEAGETVAAGIPVFKLGDLENPWIKVYVKEDKIGQVKLGQKAVVTTDSYPGKTYEGSVSFISGEAEFTPKNVQTQEERVKLVFGVKVNVKNVNDELKPGMPADVSIMLDETGSRVKGQGSGKEK
jgi:HlyD family secretion protein